MPTFALLTGQQRQAITEAAFGLLEGMGVRLTEPDARALLHGSGARIEGEIARIPGPMVEEAIRRVPSRFIMYGRDGRPAFELGGHAAHFGAHTDAPDVIDPFGGGRRLCRFDDVGRNAALIDALPRMAYMTASGLVADRPPQVGDRAALAQCLIHSVKPVLSMPVDMAGLRGCHRMAALAVGSPEALREKPLLIVYAEPISPLVHPDESIRKLLYCADHHIPLVYSPYAAMGATAPMSRAGIVAQLCAESLSALVIHQLRQPGAPFIFGGMASLMDMRTTVFSYGAPEFQAGNTLMAEMAHHFDLPNFGTAGTSDAQFFDGQALMEVVSSCLMAALSGANLVHDVGLLGSATVVVPEMIVAADAAIAMLDHLLAEVDTGADDLALDVIAEVGHGGEFVTHPHTLAHFRSAWYTDLLYRGGAKRLGPEGYWTFEEAVNQRTRELMSQPPANLIQDKTAAAIVEIIEEGEDS